MYTAGRDSSGKKYGTNDRARTTQARRRRRCGGGEEFGVGAASDTYVTRGVVVIECVRCVDSNMEFG